MSALIFTITGACGVLLATAGVALAAFGAFGFYGAGVVCVVSGLCTIRAALRDFDASQKKEGKE